MKPRPYFPLLLLVFTVFLTYLNSFWGVFQFDDYNVIVDNIRVHSRSAWLKDLAYGIRPLLKFTYMLNWISGLGIFGFHLLNLLIHTVNSILIYFLSLRFIKHCSVLEAHSSNIALIAALLFALHPVQTEAVTYISGRSTSLMAMFYLGSIIAYIYGTETNRGAWLYLLSPALFMMAVLSKETGVTLPLALLLWTSIQNQKNWGVVLRMQIVYWAMFICILIVLIAHPNYGTLLEYSFDIRSLKDNLLSQINGVIYLISRLFMINRLNIDPDLPVQSTWTFLLAVKLAMLLALILTGMISLKRIPWLGFALLWFFLHLLPTNSVVPRLDVANERQLYLPVWGIFLGLSIGMVRFQTAFKGGKGFVQAVTLILLVILGYFTAARNYTYRSEIALWEDTVRKSPQKARVYNNLGYAYAIAGRNEEAKRAYLTALSLDPDYSLARNNLARISGLNP